MKLFFFIVRIVRKINIYQEINGINKKNGDINIFGRDYEMMNCLFN